MSVISKHLNAAEAERYFESEYTLDDYYSQEHRCIGQWMGKGAAALGLSGDVKREDFSALLQGRRPGSDEVLVASATHNRKRRAGWDVGLAPPKSLNVQALRDPRLIDEAHNQAVETTLRRFERHALARIDRGHDVIQTSNLVVARFRHDAARPTENAPPDPHIHDHLIMLNMTQKADGTWRALDPREIFKAQSWIVAIYRAELAKNVQKLGYQIHRTPGEESPWELAGWTRDQVLAFSRRQQEITQKAKELNANGAAAHHDIAFYTRQPKRSYTPSELLPERLQRAAALGIDLSARAEQARRAGNIYNGQSAAALAAVDYAINHLSEHHAVLDRRALEAAALEHSCGRVDYAGIGAAIDYQLRQGKLISTGANARHAGGAFVTPQMLALEQENIALVENGKHQARAISGSFGLRFWAAAKGLSHEQHHAAEVTLTSRDWVTAIEGFAGTAKTTTTGFMREIAQKRGYTVRAFGMNSAAVRALELNGFEARTIDSLIRSRAPEKKGPEIWFVDESGLIDTRKFNATLKAARDRNVERIVLVGDQSQHQAIGAGAPMRQLLKRGNLTVARLTTIHRQKEPGLRQAVELSRTASDKSIDLLNSQGRVHQIADATVRHRQIATDYVESVEAGKNTLVVSPANDERKALNATIRDAMIASGHVAKEGLQHSILVRRDLSQAQLQQASSYKPRNVLHFNIGSWRIPKGSHLTVEAIDAAANSLTLRTSLGRIHINPAHWQGIQAYTPEQRTLSQGDRIQFRIHIHDKEHEIANGQFASIDRLTASKWVQLRFDERTWWGGQRKIWMKLSDLKHIDHGYASTSHAAQGATVDKVLINADSRRAAVLVNQRQHYVALSRAREDAQLYTNDIEGLKRSATRDEQQELALDAIMLKRLASYDAKLPPARALPPDTAQRPARRRGHSFGFRLAQGS